MSQSRMTPAEVLAVIEGKPLGATRLYPQDRYPLLVVGRSKTAKTIEYVPVRTVGGDTGHKPARFEGPWPVWDHTYTEDELARLSEDAVPPSKARWSEKRGGYYDHGTPIAVGVANYYRNFSY